MSFALVATAASAIPITPVTPGSLAEAAGRLGEMERRWIGSIGFTAEAGAVVLLPSPSGGLARVLVGMKPEEPVWALGGLPTTLPAGTYALDVKPGAGVATRMALGWALGAYEFSRYKPRKRPPAELAWPEQADRAEVERLARAILLTRDLINTPAEDMGPAELAGAAESVAGPAGARYSVIAGEALLDQNYPMIHAVGRASARPPLLVDLIWGDPKAPKVTLVGKGVCFDSGGLDLKTAAGMQMMKKDMGGAALMIGLASAIMDAGLPVRLRLLVPAVENAVSGNALRPLDILRTRKGITVEIGNTDAEGRLILCDALSEADSEKPALLLDAATLTGAARVALGPELPALFANDDGIAEMLLAAGKAECDPLWRLPLWPPYRTLIDSKLADISSTGESPHAGAITAALYLAEFVAPGTPWAHLDTFAWNAKPRPGRPEGGEALALRALYAAIKGRFGASAADPAQ